MNALKLLLAISSFTSAGCATTPEWNSEAAESVRPMRDVHMACMVANAVGLDEPSRDPQDLVLTVEGLCAPLLEPMRAYIAQEGYGEATADAYVEQVLMESRREAAESLVRVRRQARKSP